MTAESTALQRVPATSSELDESQTKQACRVLLRHISDERTKTEPTSPKRKLLDEDDDDDDLSQETTVPIWLILSTKKHILDQKRLKPGKIKLPHSINDSQSSTICLITADPQNTYSSLIDQPSFPANIRSRITRVISFSHLKKDYKSFESRRKLFAEHEIFLADDRIVTYLPKTLGKIFYKSGSKRPMPISISAHKERDEEGKRIKIDPASGKKINPDKIQGGRGARSADQVAKEIDKALGSALVNLAPAATTAIKVARADFTPEMTWQNVEAVVHELVAKYVPMGWKNVRALHIKTPESMSFPIWLASELWADEEDVLEESEAVRKSSRSIKSSANNPEPVEAEKGVKRKSEHTSKPKEAKHTMKKRKLALAAQEKASEEAAFRKQKLKTQKALALAEGL